LLQGAEQLAPWLRSAGPVKSAIPVSLSAWETFAQHVSGAGLSGLLLEQARECGVDLPVDIGGRLREQAMKVAADNMNSAVELEKLLRGFNKDGVPVILLKGAALDRITYPRPDLRPMSDVDLLIKPETVGDSLRLLEELGCRRIADPVRDDFFPKYCCEVQYVTRSPRPLRIDLHARPFHPLRFARTIPDDGFWDDAREVTVGKSRALVLRPELMLVHLAGHAAFHGCSRLIWLYDMKRFVETLSDPLDWDLVTQTCRRWRLSLAVGEALRCAGNMLDPVCPPEVIEELASHHIDWRDRLTLSCAPGFGGSAVGHAAVSLLCTPGIGFRLGYVLAMLSPGHKHLADVYPFRHFGWVVCAHIWRAVRALGRTAWAPLGAVLSLRKNKVTPALDLQEVLH